MQHLLQVHVQQQIFAFVRIEMKETIVSILVLSSIISRILGSDVAVVSMYLNVIVYDMYNN